MSRNKEKNDGKHKVEEAEVPAQNGSTNKLSKNALRRRSRAYNHRQYRIIVRNLSYNINEKQLRAEFEQFGNIEEINVLKRPNGSKVGCAFLQFSSKEESDRAIQEKDSHIFMGRKLEVHYALDKKSFGKVKTEKKSKTDDVKEEMVTKIEDDDDLNIKSEDESDDDDDDDEDKDEDDNDEDDDEKEDDDDEDDDGDEYDEEEDQSEDDEKPFKDVKPIFKKDKVHTEVEEGRSVFVKNLPYDVTADELKQCMSQFGTVNQVLINKDRISGHSKGTAFVIFKVKDSAQLSCRQTLKLKMRDQYLEIMEALRKKNIKQQEKLRQEKRAKDARNLYLLKEGLIMAGSSAAKDVSKSDMANRLRLEQRCNEILKNNNRFVARERLTVHNIPEGYVNDDLRKMVIKFTSQKPKECRVMREMRPSFGNPSGRSRGYGFLSFARHEIALEVLRKLNNNPGVFGKNCRPIVSFSIEDRNVYNIRQKRLEKSRLNNPTYQKKIEEQKMKRAKKLQSRKEEKRTTLEQLAVAPSAFLQKLNKRGAAAELVPKKKQRKRDLEETVTTYTGELSKEGRKGIRSNRKISHQADAHMARIKQERKDGKKQRRKEEHARNRKAKLTQRSKPKMNVKELQKEDAFFKQSVGKYKEMISQATKQPTRSKWYSE